MSEADPDEMDQISTIALLIDDLSSEDPNAKLHSIQRLRQIASLLGAERTAEELIPMLTELIDKIDCNPEIMMHLAEQLGNLCEVLESPELVVVLLDPLEIMIKNDETLVRDKAISSLQKAVKYLNAGSGAYIKDHYLPLLKRQKKGDLFSMRIAASHLYADLYHYLKEAELKQSIKKKLLKLAKDDTPMVRRGVAQSLPKITEYLSRKEA